MELSVADSNKTLFKIYVHICIVFANVFGSSECPVPCGTPNQLLLGFHLHPPPFNQLLELSCSASLFATRWQLKKISQSPALTQRSLLKVSFIFVDDIIEQLRQMLQKAL